jgi:hypothetical protein
MKKWSQAIRLMHQWEKIGDGVPSLNDIRAGFFVFNEKRFWRSFYKRMAAAQR